MTDYSLRTLEPFRPCDLTNPHRYASPEETARLIDACREDDRRESAKCTAFERATGIRHGQGVEFDLDDTPPPFADHAFLRGLLWGIGLAAMVGLVAAVVLGEWVLAR